MKNSREKMSYCLGLEAARSLTKQFAELELPLLEEGFCDGIHRRALKLSEEELHATMNHLKDQMEKQKKAFLLQVAERNKEEGEAYLLANKSNEGVVTLPSGLQYKILKTGTGSIAPRLFDAVSVHVCAYLMDGHLLENSYQKGRPQTIPLNRMITGWSEALQKMHVGDKWQLFVPPYLAYGETGLPGEIPPNTTLIFELELVDIQRE
jgi:FKBP-type peptidyl-prolyl cis-trans isomerase FklB